ncbi:MAG: polysaccharide lyase 6 family protein [Pseudomonadota bacterium]
MPKIAARAHVAPTCLLIILASCLTMIGQAAATDYLVRNQSAYQEALSRTEPGDRILLADGEWKDFEIVFEATGTEENPITLMAQTPGEVFITGKSNLRIGGEHLVIWGLTFRDGYSPSDEVISFRRDSETLANNVRLVENVIENFNKPDREDQDSWVVVYGQNNRIDQNAFLGKTNKGPTLIVRLNTPESQNNNHLIEKNFFGGRPPLGGNGGETMRIGVSQYSRVNSGTVVRENYFERCDGEVEIISIKSEGNLVTENVFYESRGSVVFRHGGRNEVSRNVFFGNGVPDTGGIRVINDNQVVKENYLEGLRGRKFLGALVVMNGVPNSPENRYHQVENALIQNNSFVDIAHMGFGVGSDEERSAVPISSTMSDNLLVSEEEDPVGIFDEVSGISFENNVANNHGFEEINARIVPDITTTRADNGLIYPEDSLAETAPGAPRDLTPISREATGPRHYTKAPQHRSESRTLSLEASEKALRDAIETAMDGDILQLPAGRITISAPLVISNEITITGADDSGTTLITSPRGLFVLTAGADLTLSGLMIDQTSEDHPVIKAGGETYRGDYRLRISEVTLSSADGVEEVAALLAADPATFAREVHIEDLTVTDWPGPIIDLSGDGLEGWYLTDEIIIRGSQFSNIDGPLVRFGREGRDESTFGPRFALINSRLDNVARADKSLDLNGVDGLQLLNNQFAASGAVNVKRRVLGLPFEASDNKVDAQMTATFLGVDDEPMDLTLDGNSP